MSSAKKADETAWARMQHEAMTKLEADDLEDVAKHMASTGCAGGGLDDYMPAWSGLNTADVRSLLPPESQPQAVPIKEEQQEEGGNAAKEEKAEDDESSDDTGGDSHHTGSSGKSKGKGKGKGTEPWFDRDTVVNKAKRLWLSAVAQLEQQIEGSVNEAETLMAEVQGNATNVHFKHAYPVLSRRKVVGAAMLSEKCDVQQLMDLVNKVLHAANPISAFSSEFTDR